MSLLDEYLVDSCKLVAATRSEYGDYVEGTGTTLSCRWRFINTIQRGTNRETNDSDAMVWFSPTSGVTNGAILEFEGATYQVERITKAKRLGETEVQFIKCDVKRTDIGLS